MRSDSLVIFEHAYTRSQQQVFLQSRSNLNGLGLIELLGHWDTSVLGLTSSSLLFLFISLLSVLLDYSFVPSALCFWNLTTLVNDKLRVQVGVALVGWGRHLVQSCVIHWRWQKGLWLCLLTPDSLFLQGRNPRMERLMWIAAQGDWIPIKWVSAWLGGASSHPRRGVYSSAYGPGQLLNPVQLVQRNLGPGNKGAGGGIGKKRWSWGDWRWKLKCMFKGYTLVITLKSAKSFFCMYVEPSMHLLSEHSGVVFLHHFHLWLLVEQMVLYGLLLSSARQWEGDSPVL